SPVAHVADHELVALDVHPDDGDLGAAVGVQGGEVGEGRGLDHRAHGVGDLHRSSSLRGHYARVSFMPIVRSTATMSSGRAKGAGAGWPGVRGRPMALKNSSSPCGVISHIITSSSAPSLTISCLTS